MVDAQPQMRLVRTVTSGEEAIAAVEELAPDVLVLDMEIAGFHTFSVTRAVLALQPQLGIVAWIGRCGSTELPDMKASSMQRASACCCVEDAADDVEIAQAIVCASGICRQVVPEPRLTLRTTLTRREHELLALLASGPRAGPRPGSQHRHPRVSLRHVR